MNKILWIVLLSVALCSCNTVVKDNTTQSDIMETNKKIWAVCLPYILSR